MNAAPPTAAPAAPPERSAPAILDDPARPPAPPARVRFGGLTADDLDRWAEWHRTNPDLASPYFHPDFTRHAAAARAAHARDDVRVARLCDRSGAATAFFPHQRTRLATAAPPGGRLCDFHGVVAGSGIDWTAGRTLRAADVWGYAFHMLPPGQGPFLDARVADDLEPREGVRADLAGGFDAWVERREAAGSKRHRKIEQFRRRTERDLGPVAFAWHSGDPAAWDALLEWKRAQYAATGFTDVLAAAWVRSLLERCRDARPPAHADDGTFGGVLSTLRAGGRLLAVHFGLRSGGRLHSWFPAYDRQFRTLSPGNVLMLEALRAAADRGVDAVDLGAGDEGYKYSYGTDTFPLHAGRAEEPGLFRAAARAARRGRDALKTHPAGAPARRLAAATRGWRERLSLG